jgi:hypothetical protein
MSQKLFYEEEFKNLAITIGENDVNELPLMAWIPKDKIIDKEPLWV